MRSFSLLLTIACAAACVMLQAASAAAQPVKCGERISNGGFEAPTDGGWFYPAGTAGIDHGLGYSYTGANNGWVRARSGWNAINQWVGIDLNQRMWLEARIRTNITNGSLAYLSVRDPNGNILAERHVTKAACGYQYISMEFNSGWNTQVLVYAGFWGNGQDQWMQIDDVHLEGSVCNSHPPQSCQ